jgi:glycosyltransferase involved in cell wall biosynthesis
MRIGVDARELCGRPTGVGRYLAGLLRQWTDDAAARAHDFVLYTAAPLAVDVDGRRFPTRLVEGAGGTWWQQAQLPAVTAGDHLDVFFAPAYTAPLRLRVPTVVAIHDLSYIAHPEWFALREGMRRRWLTRASAHRARAIVTLSEFSKREIVERLGVPGSDVRVIPIGIDAPPLRSAAADGHPRILYVGSIFNRRRVVDLIRGTAALARRFPDVTLDIVGDNRTFPPEDIERAIGISVLSHRARWHRYVGDDDLRALYERARAFAFLSEYEGLGLPPLEALAYGVPPVVLDTEVARESLGDAAVYVPFNSDVPAIARALERALFDTALRARVLAAAPAALARYNWPRAGDETLAVLESVVSRQSSVGSR